MQAHPGHIFEFGAFRLVERERLLLRNGQPVQLSPKVFDTLLVLVENRGRLVDKQELMSRLWPDSFVEEVNLNRSISTLRKALGGASEQATYIATVPKHGYRFVVDVVEVDTGEASLIFEKHTSAEIITEEDEDITYSSDPVLESSFEPRTLTVSRARSISRQRRHRLLLAGCVTLVLVAAVGYLRSAGNPGRTAPTSQLKSIAVLPFKTLAPTEQNEYLGVGIADVLITTLSNLKELNVRSARSVLKYGESEVDSVTAGRALKADAVLEGSVQRINDRIRVTVRLIRVQDEGPMWGGKFDEPAGNMLKVQDSIAERVAAALLSNFNSKERGILTKRYTGNGEAYHLYLKGRYFWNKRSAQDYVKAIDHYEQAIAQDMDYALAYAGMADAYSLLANDSIGQVRQGRYEKARAAALRSLEIDESLSEAHTALGWIKRNYEWDWPGAEREFKRAIELSPNSADAHQWYALLLTTVGRIEEAIAEIKRAKELEPIAWVIDANSFAVFFRARQFDETIAQCRDALALDPLNGTLRSNLVTLYVQKKMYDEAIAEINGIPHSTEGAVLPTLLARAYVGKGQKEMAKEAFEYVKRLATERPGALFYLATIYLDLGEKDKALECLRKAYESRDERLVWLKLDPRFDTVHSDPRYRELLGRMGLAD